MTTATLTEEQERSNKGLMYCRFCKETTEQELLETKRGPVPWERLEEDALLGLTTTCTTKRIKCCTCGQTITLTSATMEELK